MTSAWIRRLGGALAKHWIPFSINSGSSHYEHVNTCKHFSPFFSGSPSCHCMYVGVKYCMLTAVQRVFLIEYRLLLQMYYCLLTAVPKFMIAYFTLSCVLVQPCRGLFFCETHPTFATCLSAMECKPLFNVCMTTQPHPFLIIHLRPSLTQAVPYPPRKSVKLS